MGHIRGSKPKSGVILAVVENRSVEASQELQQFDDVKYGDTYLPLTVLGQLNTFISYIVSI